ncbi:DUF447 domain-containing protein [Sulfurisphaera ohwakuensis]|uniref:DUF447 domain-containing protein n=1 Tax=Sulfurisphaera ohwakuensis TaxID=69656 RepID=UPI0036F3FF61
MDSVKNIINFVFPYDGIYEVILGSNGVKPNLAPIGIIKEGNTLKSKVYKDTLTFSNLIKYQKCSLNIITDSRVFFEAFFNELKIEDYIDNIPIIPVGVVFLANCYYEKLENPTYFFYDLIDYKKYGEFYHAFNRGNSMLIDLLIHVSRLDIYSKEDIEKYLPIIKYEIDIIRKTMPNDIKIIEKIKELMLQKGLKI